MADGDTYINIGTTLEVAPGLPATFNDSGYSALLDTGQEVGGVISIPESGDTSQDVSEPTLRDGRVEHFNGQVDGGEMAIPIKFIEGDPGQAILLGASNTNDPYSFRETDADGTVRYYWGRIGSVRERERTANSFKGFTATVRVNSPRLTVAPA